MLMYSRNVRFPKAYKLLISFPCTATQTSTAIAMVTEW